MIWFSCLSGCLLVKFIEAVRVYFIASLFLEGLEFILNVVGRVELIG